MKSVYPGLDKVADMVSSSSSSKKGMFTKSMPNSSSRISKKKRLLTVPTRTKS